MKRRMGAIWLVSLVLALACPAGLRAGVIIVWEGEVRAAIHVAPEVMQTADEELAAERERLRASVEDLAHYLEKMSGGRVEVITGPPRAEDGRIPILIGSLAAERFGPPATHAPAKQGFRVVVTPEAVGLMGESDLGASYAIYELLDQLGCRWYMPSEMGEVIPKLRLISLREQDLDSAPYTYYRGIWYADQDYTRRNRIGGLVLSTGHALESYVSEELRAKHPEWLAKEEGHAFGRRLKWSKPGVAEAIADEIIRKLDEDPSILSISLSPDDGLGFDDTDDRKLDAGDWDPGWQMVSLTDRLVWFCNRIAERVTRKHPDVMFGMLAYLNYNLPPVREKLHPNIVPQIAPLSYSRAHPMTDRGEPNNAALRALVRGWAEASDKVSYYYYAYFWPEVSAPNPFITKWSINIPIAYNEGHCWFWQPETMANFENLMHAIYMGNRMAWDPRQDPKGIIGELHTKFYGHAAKQMATYWHFIDHVWVNTPEYSELAFGYLRRWTPARMTTARRLMNAAIRAARTPEEEFRIEMADQSLQLFELFMKMRRDLAEGRFDNLAENAGRYRKRAKALAYKYEPQSAFGLMHWTNEESVYGWGLARFYQETYDDASRIAGEFLILTTPPMRRWRYQVDPDRKGEVAGWAKPDFDDHAWKLTDPCLETWSTLGYHNYRGAMWYRTRVTLPEIPEGKKVYLWTGGAYGTVKLSVNGRHIPYVDARGERSEQFRGGARPASFDITQAVRPGAQNQISIFSVRRGGLGLGGLVAPVVIYREKP